MSRLRPLLVALAVLVAVTAGATSAAAEWPQWIEGLLFNAGERSAAGRRALDDGDVAAAVDRFETALRLRPDDPAAQYNAGTARLAAERPDAAPLLEAAGGAGGTVAPRAAYNLGNARYGAGDYAGAVDAYTSALRAEPGFEDAKVNLELALRRLQEQQQEQQQDPEQNQEQQQDQQQQDHQQDQQPGDEGDEGDEGEQQPDEQEPGDEEGEEQDESQPQDQQQQQPGEEGEDEPAEPQGGQQQPQPGEDGGEEDGPLPQFQDVPDMTAEEAAAILEAVENLERAERREAALEAARQAGRGGKDW